MHTDGAIGRLKTGGGAIFAETSTVIPAQAGIHFLNSETVFQIKVS
jgi:hypothetical protein